MIGTPDGLTRGPVVAVTEDRSGSIWLATARRIEPYKDGRITGDHAAAGAR